MGKSLCAQHHIIDSMNSDKNLVYYSISTYTCTNMHKIY